MPAGATMTSRVVRQHRRIMPVVLVSLAAGLGSISMPHAWGDALPMSGSSALRSGSGRQVTAYVTNYGAGTVTPIAAADSTSRPPITVGSYPSVLTITPNGKTAYVTHEAAETVTPVATSTNTPGPPIAVGTYPYAIAITPVAGAQGPTFTSRAADTVAFGVAFTFTVTTTCDPAPAITSNGRLPSGVRFANNRSGTATISGTPGDAAAGTYPLTLTARNKNGTATQAFTLTVTRAPAISKIKITRIRAGAALSRTVEATGYPAPDLAESGPLPSGISFTDNGNGTAVIAGTPVAGSFGRYPITVTATNTSGRASRQLTIVVWLPRKRRSGDYYPAGLPAILWPLGAAFTIALGSLLLIWGTGAQAWFQIIGYEDVLKKAKDECSGLTVALKKGTSLLHIRRWWFVFIPVIGCLFLTGLYSAIALILLNRDKIHNSGDNEHSRLKNADRLNELLRVAVPWYLLLLGSSFVFVGAVIQCVLALL